MVAVSLRSPRKRDAERIPAVRPVLQLAKKTFWSQLVVTVFDCAHAPWVRRHKGKMAQMPHNDLANVIRRSGLHRDEFLWFLAMLSELRSVGRPSGQEPFFIAVCLAILTRHAPEWDDKNHPDSVLLEAVVTLAAMTFSLDQDNRRKILTRSREHPWLLLSIRNPALFSKWFEDTPADYHKQLTSLLFLVLYALILRGSYPLAVQYFVIITAKGDLSLYASALVAVAPSMNDRGLSAIGRMLLAPRTQDLRPIIGDSMANRERPVEEEMVDRGRTVQEKLLQEYDHCLGATETPDPNIWPSCWCCSNTYLQTQ